MIKIEMYNKYVESRKDLLRSKIKDTEINKILLDVLEEFNIKFKNEESKVISKKFLYTLKLSKVNENKVRCVVYDRIKEKINENIEDIDNILDSIIITYTGINKINYLQINY